MNKFRFAAILAGAALALAPAHLGAQTAKPISMGMQLEQTAERPAVTSVAPDRTAAALGFKVGDILLEVDGKPVSRDVFRAYMKSKNAGDELVFKVKRGDAELELKGKAVAALEGAPASVTQPQGQ